MWYYNTWEKCYGDSEFLNTKRRSRRTSWNSRHSSKKDAQILHTSEAHALETSVKDWFTSSEAHALETRVQEWQKPSVVRALLLPYPYTSISIHLLSPYPKPLPIFNPTLRPLPSFPAKFPPLYWKTKKFLLLTPSFFIIFSLITWISEEKSRKSTIGVRSRQWSSQLHHT